VKRDEVLSRLPPEPSGGIFLCGRSAVRPHSWNRPAHALPFLEMAEQQQRDFLVRTVMWRNIVANGAEYCALWRTSEGWLLRGSAVAAPDQKAPLLVEYEVHCDPTWRTHRVQVKRTIGGEVRDLGLTLEAHGVWRLSGDECSDLRDCVDVDLGVTPATNTLPIRRLNLPIGGSQDVTAAWIKFPDLTLQPLGQPLHTPGREQLSLRKRHRFFNQHCGG
jgi:hypothetical protein